MKASAIRTLPNPEALRSFVTRIAHGVSAAAVSEEDRDVLVALPHHGDFGFGQAYLHWEPAIVVAPGTEVTWRAIEGKGKAAVEFTGTFTVDEHGDYAGTYPEGAPAPVVAKRSALVADGNLARFETVEALERTVLDVLEQTNRYVAREIEGRLGQDAEGWGAVCNHGAADPVALEHLATELLWGAEGALKDSTVLRMVHTAATTHINNQPLGSWFAINLRARAEEAVRRHIGDPHIGRKVRRLAREHSPNSIDELLDMYRRANPKDGVGRDRIIAALSAGKTIDSVSSSLSLLVNVNDADNALEAFDSTEAHS